jgi:hypothetical protein
MDEQAPIAAPEEPIQTIEPVDEGAIVREVEEFFTQRKEERRPYETAWFLNAVTLDGKSDATWNPAINQLMLEKAPAHRRKVSINLVWSKFAAKVAKMVNSRPRPIIVPASNDREDVLDARFTQQALLYQVRKQNLEEKYEVAVSSAEVTSKAFLWIYWDPEAMVTMADPQTGQVVESPEGDVAVEVGSAFELLVEDLGQPLLGKQRRIMRVSAILIEDAKRRWGQEGGKLYGVELKSDVGGDDLFQFERQIAELGQRWPTGNSSGGGRGTGKVKGNSEIYILRKELFTAPSLRYPKGAYSVVVGGQLVKHQEELPYGFHTFKANPFPVEEVSADITPSRFWPQTMIERIRGAQNAIDTLVSKVLEDLDLSLHPKWLIPNAARIPKTAINSEAGEKIYYNYFPGMPPPQIIQPRGVNLDTWRMLDKARTYLDDMTNIWPSSVGGAGDASSGFQTNLLQEAADAVYGPHKRRNERMWERMLFKLRRLMKTGYTTDRLISVTSRSNMPAVFEFNQEMIDEHAEIQVQIGSALSDLKATRMQQAIELAGAGVFGDQNSPQARRALLSLIDLGGVEEEVDPTAADVNRARNENLKVSKEMPLEPPAPWQTDAIHVEIHFEALNGPEFDTWSPQQKLVMIEHCIMHLRRHNPQMGLEMAQMLAGTPNGDALIQELSQIVQGQAAAQAGAPAPTNGGAPAPPPPGPAPM